MQPRFGLAVVVLAMPAWMALMTPTPHAPVPPCMVADESCKEALAVGPYSFWYFATYSLDAPNSAITRAVIVTHGLQRNAGLYFETAVQSLGSDRDPSLLVIAPHFKGHVLGSTSCIDPLEPNELRWSCGGQGSVFRWDDGGRAHSTGSQAIFSFSMIDNLIDKLSDTTVFPHLTRITVSGHSDGGQFTQRYAAGNQVDATPVQRSRPLARSNSLGRSAPVRTTDVSIKYVIANPGSYMYLDDRRLPKGESCFDGGTCTAEFTSKWDPTGECAETYNVYKYGLDGRTFGYMDSSRPGFSDQELRQQFTTRRVAFVLGEQDQLSNFQLDRSCAANAQGSHVYMDGSGFFGGRLERGLIFWSYMRQVGASHTLAVAPTCGHDPVCMLNSAEMIQAILF